MRAISETVFPHKERDIRSVAFTGYPLHAGHFPLYLKIGLESSIL